MITMLSYIFSEGVFLAFDPLTIAALAMSVAGGVSSLVGSAQLNKTRQSNLNAQKAESESWYNKEYYTNEVDRTENQAMLKMLTDKLKDNNKRAQATNAITGATPEVALAQNENANKAYGDVVTKMAANASNRRTTLNNMKRADDRSLYMMQDGIDAGKAQNWANLGSNAAQLGGNALMTAGGAKGATDAAGGIDLGKIVEEVPLLG